MLRALVVAIALLAPAAVQYQAPVGGAVLEPFRPPPTPYAAGHRGLSYAAIPCEPVRAAAAGAVTFAGQVAGVLIVVVAHADRIRTTYSGLATVAVTAGDAVTDGQPVGTATARLYFGARAGAAYIDPAVLLSRHRRRAWLVPVGR